MTPMMNVNASNPKALAKAILNFVAAYVTVHVCRGYSATSHVTLVKGQILYFL